MAVSRQREYLADSTAAHLLGSGTPLANALEAIGASRTTGLQDNFAVVPMYIVNPVFGRWLANLFSTHPPLQKRIRRLRVSSYRLSRGPLSFALMSNAAATGRLCQEVTTGRPSQNAAAGNG